MKMTRREMMQGTLAAMPAMGMMTSGLSLDANAEAPVASGTVLLRDDFSKLPAGWLPDREVLESLHDYLVDHKVDFKETDFMIDQDWIKRQLTKEMYLYAFDVDASDKIFAKTDPEVKKAIESMPKAAALMANARKVMAKRRQ